jgi:hypothetical protein
MLCLIPWIGVPFGLIVVPLNFLREALGPFALQPLRRCYDGIRLRKTPGPGDVSFVYHTYRGLLLWAMEDEHQVIAPAEDAERLLGRLLRFNLTWGLLCHGMIFIPFLAVGNYYVQRRSIRKQVVQFGQKSAEHDGEPINPWERPTVP